MKVNMSADELYLLALAIQREQIRNPSAVKIRDNSIFFQNVHVFFTSFYTVWPSIGNADFECKPPGFFSFKNKRTFNKAISIFRAIRTVESSTEKLICEAVPAAKDIIAERILVEEDVKN